MPSQQSPESAGLNPCDASADALANRVGNAGSLSFDRLIRIARLSAGEAVLAGLVHELNQPLGVMANYAQVGLHYANDKTESQADELRDSLNRICEQAVRAGRITRWLGRFVDPEDFHPSPVAVNLLVRETLSLLRGLQRLHQTRVELVLDDDLPDADADRVEIMLTLAALVKNAMEAMTNLPPPSRSLLVRTELGKGGEIEIAVEDSGPGLEPGEMELVFSPFYTTKPESIGLGLPLCRSIVSRHGGRIQAVSKPAAGGSFRFTLPVAKKGEGVER